jgi:hypothetical protein
MGIDICTAKFLQSEVRRGLCLGRTLTLGHQSLYMGHHEYRSIVESLGISYRDTRYADDLFRGWGATDIDVMDVSNYEGANILHDLNQPVDARLVESYNSVFDGGALEHVFNFPVALKNCMEMVRVGGHFITVTPANAYCGHGFYQFSPEMFFSALSVENGFSVERVLFVHRDQWYSVQKPAEINQRVELLTFEPTLFFVSARRVERKPVFAKWPQQSDYLAAWDDKTSVLKAGGKKSFKESVVDFSSFAKNLQTRWRIYKGRQECKPSNRRRFVPVNLD